MVASLLWSSPSFGNWPPMCPEQLRQSFSILHLRPGKIFIAPETTQNSAACQKLKSCRDCVNVLVIGFKPSSLMAAMFVASPSAKKWPCIRFASGVQLVIKSWPALPLQPITLLQRALREGLALVLSVNGREDLGNCLLNSINRVCPEYEPSVFFDVNLS